MRARDARRRILAQLDSLLGLPDDVRGLIAEGRRHLPMRALHLVMRAVELRFPRLVRGDLGGAGAVALVLLQVRLDLLTAWARGLQIRGRVASDFRLSTLAALNLVPEAGEAQGQLGAIHRGPVLLRPIELPRLQRTDLAARGVA